VGSFIRELIHVGLYKRSQGRITRQVTFAGLLLTIALGLLRMSSLLVGHGPHWQYGVPLVLLAAGGWICFRLVNFPAFADFLIAVEAEMNKVSWPTRLELVRASMVVIVVIFALAFILAGYDLLWRVIFHYLGIA
jgi:preprotein translocase subunit SecE